MQKAVTQRCMTAAGPKNGGITLLQLVAAVAAVLAATAALTSHPASPALRRVAPRPRARVMAGGNATVGWRDTGGQDRLGDESPEDQTMLSLLDTGLRGFSSNMGWLPADEREEERGRIAPEALMSVYLRVPTYEKRPVVKAVVFYGRRYSARLLNCYLERNLLRGGGLLSEVLFVVNTSDEDDLAYLPVLMGRNPEYRRTDIAADAVVLGSTDACWNTLIAQLEPEVYYVKLDDDIVYIQDMAVASMLAAKLRGDFHLVSANVVNHARLTWVHGMLGAMEGYQEAGAGSKRWVPTSGDLPGLEGTPAERLQYDAPDGCQQRDARCAAIAHYSLFNAVHRARLKAYYFPLWDFNANCGKASLYEDWHMHMVLFQGRDLIGLKPQPNMDVRISTDVCRRSDRHCGAVGPGALAAHLAYVEQAFSLLNSTDVLQQYHVLAETMCQREQMPTY